MISTFNSNIESMREFLGEATVGELKIYGGHCPLATPWFCLHKPKCEKSPLSLGPVLVRVNSGHSV